MPFVYLWQLPDRPMMLGATIPVFGSTFYTHSWLGMPVQWCGLVYAYHVLRLANTLERHHPKANGSPLPLNLNFSPADWRRLAELITVSAQYQQFDKGELKGTYPDSLTDFQKRNPAFINPEDIAVNVLALNGYDPDIKTVPVRQGNRTVVISSGAEISDVQWQGNRLRFTLRKGLAANIARRQKSKRLRQRLLNFWSIRTFHRILERKAREHGVPLVFVNPNGTSRTCLVCGDCLRGQDKECPSCGLNRHYVAAINIACRGQEKILVGVMPQRGRVL